VSFFMQRTKIRTLRIPIRLKLYKKGKMTLSTTVHQKSRIMSRVVPKSWEKAYLKVSYGGGHYNDGVYTKMKDFKQAFHAFTDKRLLDYLEQ